ncbi:MAG: type II toxin-antitoxin system RelE/ParE family toxin [Gammaproteobacteria bacterium]|nr:type II toxin-antitoxin system RelE/ParE family toxin [Gammaproteobacteria bacterium]MCH9763542.1 type II toxin-antitoxin system RelE/ParE family toxin [Gammaproteobacteria bacterium]
MEHFKVKRFSNEAKKDKVSDVLLFDTLNDFLSMEANDQQKFSLGAGLYKLRLATKEGKGKSGGARSILAFRDGSRVVWLHLFSKNEKGNVSTSELKKLKVLSKILLDIQDNEVDKLIKLGELHEVNKNV